MENQKNKTVALNGHGTHKIEKSLGAQKICQEKALHSISKRTYKALKSLHSKGYDTFLSGMAEGFDILAAEVVIQLKKQYPRIKLIAVIPFTGQDLEYSELFKKRYNYILDNADDIILISQKQTRNIFFIRNDYLLDNSSYIVCYYSGLRGGTMYTHNRAEKANTPIINIYKETSASKTKKIIALLAKILALK